MKFLKSHIKFKVSELFFSDAIIMVEGVSEYSLLPYYVEQKKELALFNEVCKVYGAYSAIGLMNMTHEEMPWKSTPTGEGEGHVIAKEKMQSFFKKRLKD